MALLKITCTSCNHEFYRIAVACNHDGVDTSCPVCEQASNPVHVEKPKNEDSPFAGCKHV